MAFTKSELATGVKLGLGLGAFLYALYIPAAALTLYAIYGYVSFDAYFSLPAEYSNQMIQLYVVALIITAIVATFVIYNDAQSGTTPNKKSLAQMRAEFAEILDTPTSSTSIFIPSTEKEAA